MINFEGRGEKEEQTCILLTDTYKENKRENIMYN